MNPLSDHVRSDIPCGHLGHSGSAPSALAGSMLSATVPVLAGLLIGKASPRTWEALSARPSSDRR